MNIIHTKEESIKNQGMRISKISNQIEIASLWGAEMFKNTPIYEILECRTMLARMIKKEWLTKEGAEAFENYNRTINAFFWTN